MLDRYTKKPRGFGFVMFGREEDMERAIEAMHNQDLSGRVISVKRAVPEDKMAPGVSASGQRRGRTEARDRYR